MASGGASPRVYPTANDLSTPPAFSNLTNLPHEPSPLSMSTLPPSTTNGISTTTSSPPTTPPTKICVFCGSSPGKSPAHIEAARALGRTMASQNIHLVYGGGTVGLMGEVARTLVSLSGPESVHGVIPAPLVKFERGPDSSHPSDHKTGDNLPEYEVYGKTTVVKDMHTRKSMMAQEVLAGGPGSGFVALSGGYGTLEELMEVVTWNQLGIHNRGVVVLNIEGYWDGLLAWVRGAVESGFVGEANKNIMGEAKSAEEAVELLRGYQVSVGRFKLEWGNE
ncbi:hypothetical protein B0J14DRAFT_573449 [Halenospora varia]|nr:hypothetical protein B0J14DRAFT_573449 [Halenospora varia]